MDDNNNAGNVGEKQNDVGAVDQNNSGATGATTGKPQDNQSGNSTQGTEKMFTQDEVSKMMAREKHQGKNSVYNELGIDPDDTSAIQMFKAFVESQKTKEEKQAEESAKQKAAIAEANKKVKIAETKASLMQAGVLGEYVDDAVVIALSKLDADSSLDVETVAKDLKAKYSVWFGGNSGEGTDTNNNGTKDKTTGQKGTGATIGSTGGSDKGGKGVSGIGARLAAARKTSTQKSYWDD